jgi:hypothetical protein
MYSGSCVNIYDVKKTKSICYTVVEYAGRMVKNMCMRSLVEWCTEKKSNRNLHDGRQIQPVQRVIT